MLSVTEAKVLSVWRAPPKVSTRHTFLCVLSVRSVGFDLRDKILVEEELSDVAHVAAGVGAVVLVSTIEGVHSHVKVDSSAGVVAGEDGLELNIAALVSCLETSQECGVEVALVVRKVTGRSDARVHAGSVRSPEVDISVGLNRFAGVDVDELEIHVERDTILIFSEIPANVLVRNIVRASSHLWNQDTGALSAEDGFGTLPLRADLLIRFVLEDSESASSSGQRVMELASKADLQKRSKLR